MGLASKIISEKEKAAIVFIMYGYCRTWGEAYAIALGEPYEEAQKNIHFSTYVSRWKQSTKVQNYIQVVNEKKVLDENERIRRYEKEKGQTVHTENKNSQTFVDYTDPANQRKKLNELVNDANDPGEVLDALKVIIAGQKDDKQAAREQQIQRFYSPVNCGDCPIKEAFHKLTGK